MKKATAGPYPAQQHTSTDLKKQWVAFTYMSKETKFIRYWNITTYA